MMTAFDPEDMPPIEEILALANRAPSVHNTQPWRWRLKGPLVELNSDYGRHLPQADPTGRDLMLSCGAALHHLQAASAAFGWSAHARRFPDPRHRGTIAEVRLKRTPVPRDAVARLRAIKLRQTDRRRFGSWPVPPQQLAALAVAGSAWGAQVMPVTDAGIRRRLVKLTLRANDLQSKSPHYSLEVAAWVRPHDTHGVPPGNIPTADSAVHTQDQLARRFPGGTMRDLSPEPAGMEDAMLLVCTSSDDAISQLRAGEAMSAVWLDATDSGLTVVPQTQALEVMETRREIQQDLLNDRAYPQLVLRVGWLTLNRPPIPETPRRAVLDSLTRDSDPLPRS